MRVLLLIADLYVDVGGGQTVYRKIIEASPEINFFYFREKELPDSSRPRNAQAIPLLTPQAAEIIPLPPQPMRHNAVQAGALRQANRFARSVAGMSFDIAEMPDYHTFGAFIRSTFLHHNVSCDCIVLAMHGNISNSIALNWTSQTTRLEQLKELERVQFGSADGVYGISRRYIQEWQKLLPRSVHYIDPLNFVNLPKDLRPWKPAQLSRPILYCIGRRERRKGNDIFVDMLRWLAPSSFAEAAHIGGADSTSEKILVEAARLRAAQVSTQMDLSQSTLRNLYATPSFVVLPVRYDTLNLVALEAVFAGCPIALSTKAGVSDYLDAEHPKIPYVKLNLDDYHGSIPALQRAIDGYDKYRAKLHSALALILPQLDLRLDMYGIYSKILQQSRGLETLAHIPKAASKTKIIDFVKSSRVRNVNDVVYKELRSVGFSGVDRLISFSANESLPVALATALCKLIARVEQFGTRFIRTILGLRKRLEQRVKHSYWWRYLGLTIDSLRTPKRLRGISRLEETSRAANFSKVRYIHSQLVSPFLRVNFWADMARLYRLRKNDQLAAVYELRVLRLLGEDRPHILPGLVNALKRTGFEQEAQAALLIYQDPNQSEDLVYKLLKQRFEQHRHFKAKPFMLKYDKRRGKPRVSVIVSLYNAASKLPNFLKALSLQTLVQKGQVEFVLVDSGSPSNERQVFLSFAKAHDINAVYARSKNRETIQAAWNRGIQLAKAPYLVFLGVDETIYPEALEILAKELDDHPSVDWVMADSLVTEVNTKGLLQRDVMAYNRAGGSKDHTYLETCYVSWVGGMYRKSIHTRFGYYDETFRGAGDTEFKNRIFPHINVRFIDRMLGVFLNYPDGQTTASPMAEIEDSRAWYLFRTAGGIRYAFENRPIEDAERLLALCLGYRKSYCGHVSTDIDYGTLLAEYILSRKPDSILAKAVGDDLKELRSDLRKMEFSETMPKALEAFLTLSPLLRRARAFGKKHQDQLRRHGIEATPDYQLLNDNRHEQHSWLWPLPEK